MVELMVALVLFSIIITATAVVMWRAAMRLFAWLDARAEDQWRRQHNSIVLVSRRLGLPPGFMGVGSVVIPPPLPPAQLPRRVQDEAAQYARRCGMRPTRIVTRCDGYNLTWEHPSARYHGERPQGAPWWLRILMIPFVGVVLFFLAQQAGLLR
jgi:hypothetical protein